MKAKYSIGQYVKYIGLDLVAYKKGEIYKITRYDEILDLYGVMSELDEDYLLGAEVLEELSNEQERICENKAGTDHYLNDKDDDDVLYDVNGYMMTSREDSFDIAPFKQEHIIEGKYDFNYDDRILSNMPSFSINLKKGIDGEYIEPYEGYPPASIYILNKQQLIDFINTYKELCSSINIDELKENKYVLQFAYWD